MAAPVDNREENAELFETGIFISSVEGRDNGRFKITVKVCGVAGSEEHSFLLSAPNRPRLLLGKRGVRIPPQAVYCQLGDIRNDFVKPFSQQLARTRVANSLALNTLVVVQSFLLFCKNGFVRACTMAGSEICEKIL